VFHTKLFDVLPDDEPMKLVTSRSFTVWI